MSNQYRAEYTLFWTAQYILAAAIVRTVEQGSTYV